MPAEEGRPLTRPAFWDDFWKATRLPAVPDRSRRYERCFMEAFEEVFSRDEAKTVFEAGCAPGAWLTWFHKAFGYAPYGCDTSERGVELTRENFRLNGVPGRVERAEFLDYAPGRRFDVVVSLGFIEHFSDPAPVLRKHVELLAPGGTLVLEVPNLVGLNAWLSTPELLAVHNRSVMDRAFFERFAEDHALDTLRLGYLGGLEPDNLAPPRSAYGRRALLKALRGLRLLPGAGAVQSPWHSAFLMGIFRKPAGERA